MGRRRGGPKEAIETIAEFINRYNREWIVGKLGYKTPAQARADHLAKTAQPAA
jgi:transposase InsO family protein